MRFSIILCSLLCCLHLQRNFSYQLILLYNENSVINWRGKQLSNINSCVIHLIYWLGISTNNFDTRFWFSLKEEADVKINGGLDFVVKNKFIILVPQSRRNPRWLEAVERRNYEKKIEFFWEIERTELEKTAINFAFLISRFHSNGFFIVSILFF